MYEELLMEEEGLKGTENELIHIGRPLEFQEEEFLKATGRTVSGGICRVLGTR